jgi:chromatin segregation and condensation protein Rec8/ScpA/Scc1 (kleisin family)
MKANQFMPSSEQRVCQICSQVFKPHPKVKDRQKVCSRFECQRLRQKLNQMAWLERNPVDYKKWYQDYGKAWQQNHPGYYRDYRKQKQAKGPEESSASSARQPSIISLVQAYQLAKKEQLTLRKTNINNKNGRAQKEQLNSYYYLLKANGLRLFPLQNAQKEQLVCCLN